MPKNMIGIGTGLVIVGGALKTIANCMSKFGGMQWEEIGRGLAENVSITSFEGETETTIMFQYGKDFFNGDIVQIANEYGHETKARILEIVRSEDKDGYSVYPTFKTIEQEGA